MSKDMTEQEYQSMLTEADGLIGRELDDAELERLLSIAILTGEYEDTHFPIGDKP